MRGFLSIGMQHKLQFFLLSPLETTPCHIILSEIFHTDIPGCNNKRYAESAVTSHHNTQYKENMNSRIIHHFTFWPTILNFLFSFLTLILHHQTTIICHLLFVWQNMITVKKSFPPPEVKGDLAISWLYDEIAKQWKYWLPEDALETLR